MAITPDPGRAGRVAGVTALWKRHRLTSPVPPFREAVVLSGGGSLGAVQVGALRALLDGGVRPDLLVGCSVGALNAAYLASDPTPARARQLEEVWLRLDRRDVFGGGRSTVAGHVLRRHDHLYEPDALHRLIRTWVDVPDLGGTAVPVHVVTTDLQSGAPCWWSEGDPVTVLSASACLPAVFPPVALGGSLHVDGGVTCPVPTGRALDLGAARVWVVDVTGGSLGRRDHRMTALDVLLHSFAISRSHLDRHTPLDRPGQQVLRVPHVDVGRVDLRDFTQTARLIALGRAAGEEALRGAAPAAGLSAPRRAARRAG